MLGASGDRMELYKALCYCSVVNINGWALFLMHSQCQNLLLNSSGSRADEAPCTAPFPDTSAHRDLLLPKNS